MDTLFISTKKIFTLILKEILYGGHLVSFDASIVAFAVVLLFNLPFNLIILIIPYLGAQIVYSYNYYKEIINDSKSNPERSTYFSSQKKIKISLIIIYLSTLFTLLLFTNIPTFLLTLSILIIGILYTAYFKKVNIKYLLGFKNFYTSFNWTLAIFLVPLFYNFQIKNSFLLLALFAFFRFFINTVFFDIKDIESDKKEKVNTFGVILGKPKTIILLHILNLFSIIPIIIGVTLHYLPKDALFLAISFFYCFYYLNHALFVKEKALRTLTYIVVESEDVLWPIFIIIGRIFFK